MVLVRVGPTRVPETVLGTVLHSTLVLLLLEYMYHVSCRAAISYMRLSSLLLSLSHATI
jgi:hypothetical protein